jgi:hypothetical protein
MTTYRNGHHDKLQKLIDDALEARRLQVVDRELELLWAAASQLVKTYVPSLVVPTDEQLAAADIEADELPPEWRSMAPSELRRLLHDGLPSSTAEDLVVAHLEAIYEEDHCDD